MTPQELKNSILQLAIQGKLVEQRPEEGTAEDLYRQIQAEKYALIKARKIKKEKALLEITEDEKPFDIPESWMWVHLNQIAESGLGKTLDKAKNAGELCPYLCSINVYWNGISLEKVKEAKFTEDDKVKYRLQRGDLLICEGGDVGRSAIWDSDEEMYYQNALHRVRFYGHVLPQYFKMVIECYKGIGKIDEYSKGMTIKHLVQNALYAMALPLPPLAEQKRIVAKIEELIPLIDRYEQAWSRLEDFNQRFPGDMQKSILQMAIQGKLVEQRPEEGTGEELYHQMQNEKQALIKAGRIKKEKPMPGITEDEKPFDIPESWMWVRLGTLTELITSGSRDWAQYYAESGDVFLRMGNLSRDSFKLRLDKIQHVLLPEHTEGQRTVLQAGDLLFSITGEVGTLGLIPEGFGKAYINQHTAMIRFLVSARNRYIPYLLLTDYAHKYYNGNQHGIKNSFRLDTIAFMPIPLPPLAEQKRIVDKLEELLPLCKRLK